MIQPDDAVLPAALMRRLDLKPSAKLVWAYIHMRQGRNACAWPNVTTIAADTGLNRTTVIHALAELEAAALLTVTRLHGRGSRYQVARPSPAPMDDAATSRESRPVGNSDQSETPTATSRESQPPPVGKSDRTSRKLRPVTLSGNPSSEPVRAARESAPPRRLDPMDFSGAPTDAVVAALSNACVAAGGVPRARGGDASQAAFANVAMMAAELAAKLGEPVQAVLAQSAQGFVAIKGTRARTAWWPEAFETYLEKGRESGPGPAEATPELERLGREAADLARQLEHESDPAERARLDAERRRNAALRTRLKRQVQETASV